MSRVPIFPFMLFCCLCIAMITMSSADEKHHKVILHVPYKVHTIHHHRLKKIPIYHYIEHRDHHHHHHHHEEHHEEPKHHIHIEEEEEEDEHGWDLR